MAGKTSTAEREDRLHRLETLQKKGVETYPSLLAFERLKIAKILEGFEDFEPKETLVALAGRFLSKRVHGKLIFGDLSDDSEKIQLYIKEDVIGKENFELLEQLVDIGDIIEIQGTCTKTKRGEKSILVTNARLLAKSVQPLPEKWHGLKDVETRFRKRELDFIANPEAKGIFLLRSKVIASIRKFLEHEDFFEVETPILQSIPGGATARPFSTHHNALNQDLFLRVAPELFLKRLIVGGFERIFEVAKCFRNEGVDTEHNPEFTQIELYAAYWGYQRLMTFTEKLILSIVRESLHADSLQLGETPIPLQAPFPRMSFFESLQKIGLCEITSASSTPEIINIAKKKKVDVDTKWNKGKLLDELFKTLVRPKCITPIFITNHPIELSPLAKKSKNDPATVDRFQLLIGKTELVNAFSELNDPIDQRERFEEQERLRKKGDDEAQYMDSDYVDALEHGMPPTAGLGLGIDRLIMLLANTQSIKEVISFPTLRSKHV